MFGKPTIRTHEPRSIHVSFFQQHVGVTLEQPAQPRNRKQQGTVAPMLSLSIRRGFSSTESISTWQDTGEGKLEAFMTEIAVEIILTAERQYRDGALHQYEWHVKRKAELEEQERQRKIAAEKAAKERQRQIEQARIDRLLKDAAAFQQANAIRQYVNALRTLQANSPMTSIEEFDRWSAWALAQADRIDPAVGGRFTDAMHDEDAVEHVPKAPGLSP